MKQRKSYKRIKVNCLRLISIRMKVDNLKTEVITLSMHFCTAERGVCPGGKTCLIVVPARWAGTTKKSKAKG